MIRQRRLLLSIVLVLVLGLLACGGNALFASLRSALRSSPALVQPLVSSGVITQKVADGVVRDFTDGGDVALQLKVDFDAIPSNATNRKQLQAQAVHRAYIQWQVIVGRGHFHVHPNVERAFTLADGIWQFVDAYYGDQAGEVTHGDIGADGLSEKEFQQALDQKIRELKTAMKS